MRHIQQPFIQLKKGLLNKFFCYTLGYILSSKLSLVSSVRLSFHLGQLLAFLKYTSQRGHIAHFRAKVPYNYPREQYSALCPQCNKADCHLAKFSLSTDIPCLFILANSSCFLRTFFPEYTPSSREEIK